MLVDGNRAVWCIFVVGEGKIHPSKARAPRDVQFAVFILPLCIHPGNRFCPPHTKAQRAEALVVLWPLGSQGWGVSDLGLSRVWTSVTCEHLLRAGDDVMPPPLGLLFPLPSLERAGVQPLLSTHRAGGWGGWESASPAVGSELWDFFYPQVVQQLSELEMEHWKENTFWVIFK